jgi:murein DD-endopeptidase MepM/ murein hydrolase activator NlpD
MQIILLHSGSHARSVVLNGWRLTLAGMTIVAAIICLVMLLYYLTLRIAAHVDWPVLQRLTAVASTKEMAERDKYLKENLEAMAIRVGEMQAQLMRLDALGERVQGLAGIKPEEFNFKTAPGLGGAAPQPTAPMHDEPLTLEEFEKVLDALAWDVEYRADYLNVVESALMADKIKSRLLPTTQPINIGYQASSFGWRLDPFSGRSGFHEGLDFAAPPGTPILAAAGGVVIAAEYHFQYGNMLEIDHGNDIITRYAHASRLLVKIGDIVRRGQQVAKVGSTGKSTGPHLHFEVLVKGIPQNPRKFLSAGAGQASVASSRMP